MANDTGDFARSMKIATSGLRAQAGRMRVISENIANADSTAQTAGGEPYRRKIPTFTSALDRSLDDDHVRERIAQLGGSIPPKNERNPATFDRFVRSEIARWSPILAAAGTGK